MDSLFEILLGFVLYMAICGSSASGCTTKINDHFCTAKSLLCN